MAEWFMEGVIDRLQANDTVVEQLLAKADLYLIPNMNPDGAFLGHLRTNFKGKDLNRAWQDASVEFSPEVFFAQAQMKQYGVDAFIDVHGDEEIPTCSRPHARATRVTPSAGQTRRAVP